MGEFAWHRGKVVAGVAPRLSRRGACRIRRKEKAEVTGLLPRVDVDKITVGQGSANDGFLAYGMRCQPDHHSEKDYLRYRRNDVAAERRGPPDALSASLGMRLLPATLISAS